MKYFKMLLIPFLSIFIISCLTMESNFVSADDDFEERYEQHGEDSEDESFEEIGEMAGWGTVIAMGAAAILFPIRKSAKWILRNVPEAKSIFLSISKFFGKYHLFIGIAALAFSIFHGVAMYLSEGLEFEGAIGLGAFILMLIASIIGTILFKNKKVKSLRTAHKVLMAFTLLIVFAHIVVS